MKKSIFTLCGFLIMTSVSAQCPTAPCTNVVTFPISTNDFNNGSGTYAGYGPDRCIQGCGVFGFDLNIPSNANYWSFNGAGTGIDIQQYINMNPGDTGFLAGINFVHHLHMAGGTGATNIFCADGSHTECTIPQCNNDSNFIHLGAGATWLMNGIYYNPGDTYQGQGNSTNVIHFVGCGSGAPLATELFYLKNGVLHWDYPIEAGMRLKMSYDALNYFDVETKGNEYTATETGYYQLTGTEKHSKVIKVIVSIKEQPKRVTLYKTPDGLYNATKIIK